MTENVRPLPRHETTASVWDDLVNESDDAWLWHLHAFGEALKTWPDAIDASFALVDDEGRLAAVMPLTLYAHRRLRGRIAAGDALSLGGPAVAPAVTGRRRARVKRLAVEHAATFAQARGATQLTVTLPALAPFLRGDDAPRVNPLLELGLENAVSQTWLVDLRGGEEALWTGLRDRARAEIRRAREAGVSVRPARAGDLRAYYDLHLATYARTRSTPHPHAYFERIWNDFLAPGLAASFVAEADGVVVAARTYGTYKKGALYWTGASTERGLELGAGSLVQWHAMTWFAANDFEVSDTGEAFPGSSDPKEQGLSLHKASFGGVLSPFFKGRRKLPNKAVEVLDSIRSLREALRT